MPRPSRPRAALTHPDVGDLDLIDVLHALADPTRMVIVQTLRAEAERACGTFPVDVTPSTLTHHFRVLREAGVIRQREEGSRRWTSLRRDDLNHRFPGLIDQVVDAYSSQPEAPRRHRSVGLDSGGTMLVPDDPEPSAT
ncbi:MAG: ArsR/SmtB family transcription factor [Streptosporangiaceae bacterium]